MTNSANCGDLPADHPRPIPTFTGLHLVLLPATVWLVDHLTGGGDAALLQHTTAGRGVTFMRPTHIYLAGWRLAPHVRAAGLVPGGSPPEGKRQHQQNSIIREVKENALAPPLRTCALYCAYITHAAHLCLCAAATARCLTVLPGSSVLPSTILSEAAMRTPGACLARARALCCSRHTIHRRCSLPTLFILS